MVRPFPVRHKNYQNVFPVKSENAVKTNNPPKKKNSQGDYFVVLSNGGITYLKSSSSMT